MGINAFMQLLRNGLCIENDSNISLHLCHSRSFTRTSHSAAVSYTSCGTGTVDYDDDLSCKTTGAGSALVMLLVPLSEHCCRRAVCAKRFGDDAWLIT